MKSYILPAALLTLSGCILDGQIFEAPQTPAYWQAAGSAGSGVYAEAHSLQHWWEVFDDASLNLLMQAMLNDNPDRAIAAERVREARGLRRSARSALFPQVSARAQGSRQDFGFVGPDNFYEAGFDSTFELDIFGVNRKTDEAAQADILAREAEYHDTTLTLIAETARTYIDLRTFERQVQIAEENLAIQEKTLGLTRIRFEVGDAPLLDVQRAENLAYTTRSSIPEFKRLSENARLRLSVLTGLLPEALNALISAGEPLNGANVAPALMTPASVLAQRPDIRAAAASLQSRTALAESATAELFPSVTLSGFFGRSEGAFSGATTIWNVIAGAAVSLLDFGRIEGQIDAARAREAQAFHAYRRTIIEAVIEVETALTDYGRAGERAAALHSAYESAKAALALSETRFKEGDVSLIDVLDVQRTANETQAQLISAQAAQAESLVRVYKSLGVY